MKVRSRHLLSGAVLVVFIILALASSEPSRVQQASKPGGPPTAIKVSAKELVKDYKENNSMAEKRYTGQLILVTGVVESVDVENMRVVLGAGDEKIYCALFPDQGLKAQRLTPGTILTIFGVCEGKSITYNMRGCLLP